MIKYCETCGNEIPRGNMSVHNKKYQAKKYCSAKCHHKSMKKEFEYKCATCGKKVIRSKEGIKHNVFCNDFCKGKYVGSKSHSSKKNKVNKVCVTCLKCGKEEMVPPSKANRKFCSNKCRAEFNVKIITQKQKNQVEVSCNNCKEKFSKKASDVRNLNFCCTNCMHEYYRREQLFAGENSGTWNGGKKTYYGKNWRKQRRKARERDNYTCQRCGITEEEYGQELSVHHITPFIFFDNYLEANRLENLISVCEPCHRKIHSGDNHPSKFSYTYKEYLVDDIV